MKGKYIVFDSWLDRSYSHAFYILPACAKKKTATLSRVYRYVMPRAEFSPSFHFTLWLYVAWISAVSSSRVDGWNSG